MGTAGRPKTNATLCPCAHARNKRRTKASSLIYDTDTKYQFLELRAKGWSLARIAEHLKVAQRTLVDWTRQEHDQIRTLRAIEFEALQEKILATREQQLTRLKQESDRLEAELAKRPVEYVSTENLYRLSALLRGEIRKVCQAPPPVQETMAAKE